MWIAGFVVGDARDATAFTSLFPLLLVCLLSLLETWLFSGTPAVLLQVRPQAGQGPRHLPDLRRVLQDSHESTVPAKRRGLHLEGMHGVLLFGVMIHPILSGVDCIGCTGDSLKTAQLPLFIPISLDFTDRKCVSLRGSRPNRSRQ